MTISDDMLGAYADGALGPGEQALVERALAEDAALRARLDAHRALQAALSAHFAPVAEEPVPERFRALLQPRSQPVDLAAVRQARAEKADRRSLFHWPHYAGMAASLAVGILAGQLAFAGGEPIAIEGGRMVARAGLERALDTQLASAPTPGETRIGLTFPDRQGRVCRSFDRADLSGIACREDGAWRVAMTAAPSGAAGQYRQAGAPAVLAEAQNMMAAPPFDLAAEKSARDAGWRRD